MPGFPFSQRFLTEFDHHCTHHIAKQEMVSAVLLEKKKKKKKKTVIRGGVGRKTCTYSTVFLHLKPTSSLSGITSFTCIVWVFGNFLKIFYLLVFIVSQTTSKTWWPKTTITLLGPLLFGLVRQVFWSEQAGLISVRPSDVFVSSWPIR